MRAAPAGVVRQQGRPHDRAIQPGGTEDFSGMRRGDAPHRYAERVDGAYGRAAQDTNSCGIADPVKAADWEASQLRLVRRLLPQVHKFVRLRQTVAAANVTGTTPAELLQNTRLGIRHLDCQGRIVETNS